MKVFNYRIKVIVFIVIIFCFAVVFAFLSIKFCLFCKTDVDSQDHILINEVMASNGRTISDADGDFEDWIELYNPNEVNIDLTGYYLSDDPGNLKRWRFPEGKISANGFLLVWASGKNMIDGDGKLHTNFRINKDGEPIILMKPDGETISDFMEEVLIPRDVSYGRYPDGSSNWRYFDREEASPSAPNSGTPLVSPDSTLNPEFSHESGFYSKSFKLGLKSDILGVNIYYTLDGSDPSPERTAEQYFVEHSRGKLKKREKRTYTYSRPIKVNKSKNHRLSNIPTTWERETPPEDLMPRAFIIKAVAYKDNVPSEIVTKTYFVNQDEYLRDGLSILSMVVDEEDFIGYEKGIYVPGIFFDADAEEPKFTGNYYEARGSGWERKASMEFFDTQGSLLFQRNLGVRIHGGTSRTLSNKSLRLYARDKPITYPLFGELSVEKYYRLKLRSSGQDQNSTFFRDALLTSLFLDSHLDVERYRPVLLFINGEYWGVTNLRERFDEYFLEQHYGVDKDEVVLLKKWETQEETIHDMMLDFITQSDLDKEDNFKKLNERMDVLSYIDHIIADTFFGRWDQHYAFWKKNKKEGLWKWYLWDMDVGMGYWPRYAPEGVESWEWDFFPTITSQYTEYREPNYILLQLLESNAGRNMFINRFADLMNTNLSNQHVLNQIDLFQSRLEPAMGIHIKRWKPPMGIGSLEEWHGNVDVLREYARKRPYCQRLHLTEFFNLPGTTSITLKSESDKGYIRINTINLTKNSPGVIDPDDWTGVYFQGIPVELEAVPQPGYSFKGWSGLPEDTSRITTQIFYEEKITIKALFSKKNS